MTINEAFSEVKQLPEEKEKHKQWLNQWAQEMEVLSQEPLLELSTEVEIIRPASIKQVEEFEWGIQKQIEQGHETEVFLNFSKSMDACQFHVWKPLRSAMKKESGVDLWRLIPSSVHIGDSSPFSTSCASSRERKSKEKAKKKQRKSKEKEKVRPKVMEGLTLKKIKRSSCKK